MNKCDLEEVEHTLCQEALSIPVTEWVRLPRPERVSLWEDPPIVTKTKNGRFFIEEKSHGVVTLFVRTGNGSDSICRAYKPILKSSEVSDKFKEDFREEWKEYCEKPPVVILRMIFEYTRKIENEKKCQRLLSAIRPPVENNEGVVDNGIPNKSWWRFW